MHLQTSALLSSRKQDVMSRFRAIKHRGQDVAPESSSIVLSREAIIGVAVGGSFLLFLVLSYILITLGRRRSRHLLDANHPLSTTQCPQDLYDSDIRTKRRLRKRSFLSDHEAFGGETEIKDKRISLPVLPPVFSKRESLNLSPFLANDDRERHNREKQRGREVYQMRRKSSWIDEDTLHGPNISPQKAVKRGWSSWLGGSGSLHRKLSSRRPFGDTLVVGSPTLPSTENSGEAFSPHRRGRPLTRDPSTPRDDTKLMEGPRPVFQISPLQQHTSTRIAIPAIVTTTPPPKPPSMVIHIPRQRHSITPGPSKQAAGNTDVRSSRPLPTSRRSTPADAELTKILRLTAVRLQDGNKSPRRLSLLQQVNGGGHVAARESFAGADSVVDSNTSSPAKSQRSAPAVLCAELEANEVSHPRSLPPTPRHRRQVSQTSITSEPDSLVATATARMSQSELTTALSSPSRSVKITGSPMQEELQQLPRPYSPASSLSSALSTLYSEVEEQEIVTHNSTKINNTRRTTLDVLTMDEGAHSRMVTSRLSSAEPQGPRAYGTRRGTLGQASLPRPLPTASRVLMQFGDKTITKSYLPNERSLQFSIYTSDGEITAPAVAIHDDPFMIKTPPSQGPVRLSQVFTPIPTAAGFGFAASGGGNDGEDDVRPKKDSAKYRCTYPIVQVPNALAPSRAMHTPTPPPKHHHHRRVPSILPPPQILRPRASSPTLGAAMLMAAAAEARRRQPSPAASEGGLSSVYESYGAGEGSGGGSSGASVSDESSAVVTLDRSTATLITVPSSSSSSSLTGQEGGATASESRGQEIQRRDGDGEHDIHGTAGTPERGLASLQEAEHRHRLASDASVSVYSTEDPGEEPDHGRASPPPPTQTLTRTQGPTRPQHGGPQTRDGGRARDTLAPLPQHILGLGPAVAEQLRRMNSTLSCASCASGTSVHSTASSLTLPAMRGGGFGPGAGREARRGPRNYLAALERPPPPETGKRRSTGGATAEHEPRDGSAGAGCGGGDVSPARRGAALARAGARARRGTLVRGGVAAGVLEVGSLREMKVVLHERAGNDGPLAAEDGYERQGELVQDDPVGRGY